MPAPAACLEVRTDDGLRLVVERHGASGAAPVLLVHGLGFSREAWAPQVAALTGAGHGVISWDLRGFGDSDRPGERYGMERLVADLEAVQVGLELEAFHLVAHSMGGMLAQRYVLAHPERVRSLVLASSSAHSGRRGSAYGQALADMSRLGYEQAMQDPRLKATLDLVLQFLADPEVRRQLDGSLPEGELPSGERFLAWIQKLTREPNPARAFAWEVTVGFSTRHDLDRIRCPALVMHGSADLIIPYVAGELLHAGLPDSRWRSFAGAGHNLPRERADEFNAALLGFLAEVA